MTKTKRISGISLLEIVVVLGILTFIISLSLSINLGSIKNNAFRTEELTLLSVLEKARSRSMSNMYQSPFGFCYVSPNYIIFRDGPGTRCVSGVSTNIVIPANKNIASDPGTIFPAWIIFSQLAGTTTPTSIHLTDGVKSTDITINYEGTINW